jgi:uncharacterized protein YoxC
MSGELGTTNLLIGIMAAVSVLEALLIIVMGVAGFRIYRKAMALVEGLEVRQVAPAMARFNAILDDIKEISARVKDETDRVDDTAHRVRANVRAKTSRIVGFVRGMRVAIEGFLSTRQPTGT